MTAAAMGAGYLVRRPAGRSPQSRSHGQAAAADNAEVERMIAAIEGEVRSQPSVSRYNELGQLYLLRARNSGDIQNFARAGEAVDRALAMAPADLDARALQANVRYSTHDFAGALAVARGIVDQDASQVGALATMGDAQLELGSYAEAATAYARLSAAQPGVAATDVRLARLAYLQGRPGEALDRATAAEAEARDAALGGPSLAFYEAYHGQVELDTGHYDDAARLFAEAVEEYPGYSVALAGLGRARAAQGRSDEATALLEKAVGVLPQPDSLAFLGDLYRLDAKKAKADNAYGTVGVIATLAQLNQQVYNRALAVFYVDHDLKVDEAVRLSEAELAVRKDVFGYDAYAWALYKSGRLSEARGASDQALAQGTVDARVMYHAGMIAASVGDNDRARDQLGRALAMSPHFDPLQAPLARAALAKLPAPR